MISVLTDFEERVREIELYFEHLRLILTRDAELFMPNNVTKKRKRIDSELHKVLKANSFLLLYNLSESSIRQALVELYDNISAKQLPYEGFRDEIKKIWIASKYKNFNGLGIDSIFVVLTSLYQDIVDIKFDKKESFSGNVDGRKIKELASTLGFSVKTHYYFKDGVKLHEVKIQRNRLAHGEVSFAKCGRDYSYEDLEKTKKQVIGYLRGVLVNVQKYIDNENFRV